MIIGNFTLGYTINNEYYSIRYILDVKEGLFHMEQLFDYGWEDSGKSFKTIEGIKRNNRMYLDKIHHLGGVVDEYFNGGISN